jgi:arylsulfatase A-like enzyme
MRPRNRAARFGAAIGLVTVITGTAIALHDSPLAAHEKDDRGRGSPSPNIVLVMTDDQALSQMNPAVMPKVSKLLAAKGTQFDNAYLTTPDCCPSRATLLTGQYGHNNGVLRNVYPLLKHKTNVLPVWLKRAGYVTAHIGRFLNVYHRNRKPLKPAPGWAEWHTLLFPDEARYYDYDLSANGRRVHHADKPRDYSTRVFHRTAMRLVRRYVPRRPPLYLELDEVAPHVQKGTYLPPPQCNPIPDPRDEGLFSDAPLPEPPSFNETDMSDKPSFVRSALAPLNDRQLTRMKRNYRCGLAALRAVDRSVGRIFHEIKRLGELGRTVFIFYTDNGSFYGEHRIALGKLNPYEEAASTPLIMRVPRQYLDGRRAVTHVSEPVANIDLAPTILRLAHAKPCRGARRCRTMDGRSLTGLIAGETPAWASDRPIGLELDLGKGTSRQLVCKYAGVRASDQVLIKHLWVNDPSSDRCIRDNEWERYDLTNDPFELDNLCFGGDAANCPEGDAEQHLRKLLRRIKHCEGIRGRDPRPPNGYYCD